MPGPVSDSFDPEFGTVSNADDVAGAIHRVIEQFDALGPLKSIVEVVHGPAGNSFKVYLSERDARVIRFALHRALESI